MGMNRALVGREYHHIAPVVVTAAQAAAYAHATSADIGAYRGSDAVVPPMLGASLAAAGLSAALFDPELQLEMVRLAHASQDMRFHGMVRPGDTVTTRATILDIRATEAGELLDIGVTATNQAGLVVLEVRSGMFIRHPRQRVAVAADEAFDAADNAAWGAAAPAWTSTEAVAPDQSARYAEATGERNPIHLDHEVAAMAGLPGITLQGMCVMAFAHNACVRHAGGDPARIARLAVTFRRPALVGDVLTVAARGPSAGPWQIRVTNQEGTVILGGGVAELR